MKQKSHNPIDAIVSVWRFLTHDIWHITNEDVKGTYRWIINIIKALFLSVRFFFSDRMMEKASALTYYTLLAIVPFFALILGIAKGFNFQDVIQNAVLNLFPGQKEIINYIFSFADNYLMHSQTGVVMGIGIILLLWVIINLISNIEDVFNQIWQQKQGRTTVRKFTDYLSIMIFVPIFILLSSGIQLSLQTFLKGDYFDVIISDSLMSLLQWTPYILTFFIFTAAYIVIPNTKVKFINALIAGIIAGIAFQIFQLLYINGQIWVSKYNAIYGSFAALPLLLLWVQMSWIICLYGAELAYAAQNVQNFNFEKDAQNISRRYYDFLTIIVASVIYTRFQKEHEASFEQKEQFSPMTTQEVGSILHLPSKLTSKIIANLSELGIIRETIDPDNRDIHVWTPGRAVGKFSVADLMNEIDEYGTREFKYDYDGIFNEEWLTLCRMREAEYNVGSERLLCQIDLDKKDLARKVK